MSDYIVRYYDRIGLVMLNELGGTLGEWRDKIDHLIDKHGEDTVIAVCGDLVPTWTLTFELKREHRRADDERSD